MLTLTPELEYYSVLARFLNPRKRETNFTSVLSFFAHHKVPFQIAKNSVMVYKGSHSDVDSYSSFFDNQRLHETKLRAELEKKGVTDVFICGIATDVCVGKSCLKPGLQRAA